MKAFAAILFSVFFLLTTMQQTTFLLLYKLNEKSITQKYCVNKNVAGSCCHGKCHLNKTISKAENEDSKNPFSSSINKVKEVEVFCHQLQKITLPSLFSKEHVHASHYASLLLEGVGHALIKPPAVLG